MKTPEMDRVLEALDHDELLERLRQLVYYFPHYEEHVNQWLQKAYGINLDD